MKLRAYIAVYDSNSDTGNQNETILARDIHWTEAMNMAFDAATPKPGQYIQGWYSDENIVTCLAMKRYRAD